MPAVIGWGAIAHGDTMTSRRRRRCGTSGATSAAGPDTLHAALASISEATDGAAATSARKAAAVQRSKHSRTTTSTAARAPASSWTTHDRRHRHARYVSRSLTIRVVLGSCSSSCAAIHRASRPTRRTVKD